MNITRKFGSWSAVLLLAFSSQVFGLDAATLFAPAFTGDGQTANWRIINRNQAGKNPWTAIGNFMIPGIGGYCSAVLVAPRIVLTANHCLYAADHTKRDSGGNPAKQLMDAKRFVFAAGVHDSTFADVIPVQEVITGGWVPGSDETAKDWVIAILTRPAHIDIVPMAFRPYNPEAVAASWGNRLVVAAYPGASFAFSSVLRFSFNCSILKSRSTSVLSHDCPAEGGSSGGPILVEEGGELRVIGVHSGTIVKNRQHKEGVSINGFVAELKAAVERVKSVQPITIAGNL